MALLWALLALALGYSSAQSNYDLQANNIEYQGEGLPEQTVLDGKVTKLDDLSPVIFLNRTKAALNCAAGSMQVELKFNENFYGIAYADFDRNSACQLVGKGALSYKLELPLKGCGTVQGPLRVFTNNIVVRFHPGLEMDGDEVITIVCRYPPPLVPPPPKLSSYVPLVNVPEREPPLGGAHILLIICAILFLTLLLLGLGVSYLCLRRRVVPVPRRLIDESEPSIISKESIQQVYIPRAHSQYPLASAESSGSDMASDYPSETPSETEHVHTNRAFTLEESYQSEERVMAAPPPAFDVKVRVKKPPPAPPSPPASTITATETDAGSIRMLTEHEAQRSESIRTVSPVALPLPARGTKRSERLEEEEREMLMESLEPIPETPIMPARKPEITSHVVDDVFLRTITEKRTIEDIERHKRMVTEYKTVAPAPQWDVTIRTHQLPESQWENFSDVSSASGMTLTPKMERVPLSLPPQYIGKTGPDLFSPELVGHVRPNQGPVFHAPASPHKLPVLPELPPARNPLFQDEDDEDIPEPIPEQPIPPNWSTLTRVLRTEAQDEVLMDTERSLRLTKTERVRWREILRHESTLRRELARSSSREEFTKVAHDQRFSGLYPPHKWEVIIRILAPPPDKPKNRYRKKSEWDSRSRRSSLPTLYEYDSDATSLRDPAAPSRRSSYRSDHNDMRSMSEMMVEWARSQADSQSEVSAGAHPRYYDEDSDTEHPFHATGSWSGRSLQRSVSQPSLARSNTEVVEQWAAPADATPTPGRRLLGAHGVSTFQTSEVRTFQASRDWRT